ncbi:hypothetical protein Q4I30_000356 [Leishmania utingensis]|uniref:Uncharacterized protein n=1 Tax=Leishmania utingensis TaxID=653362 RepID=A0AAW3B0S5_9TRYP
MHDSTKMYSKSVQPSSANSANPLDDAMCARVKQERRAALFKMLVWSPHLQQALGAALCLAPPESVSDLSAAVKANMLAGDLCSSARLTPVAGGSWRSCGNVDSFWHIAAPTTSARSNTREGQTAARSPWNTRCRVLQPPSFFFLIEPFLFSRCGLQLPTPHSPPLFSVFST